MVLVVKLRTPPKLVLLLIWDSILFLRQSWGCLGIFSHAVDIDGHHVVNEVSHTHINITRCVLRYVTAIKLHIVVDDYLAIRESLRYGMREAYDCSQTSS